MFGFHLGFCANLRNSILFSRCPLLDFWFESCWNVQRKNWSEEITLDRISIGSEGADLSVTLNPASLETPFSVLNFGPV